MLKHSTQLNPSTPPSIRRWGIKRTRSLLLWIGFVFTLLNVTQSPMWLAFSVWILVYLFRTRLRQWIDRWNLPKPYIGLGVIFGLVIELFAILDNVNLPPDERILLNPNPVADLIMAVPYYLLIGVTWYALLRRFAYTARQVFFVTGVFGIVVEQNGAILLGLMGSPIIGGLLALLILCIYGMFPLMAYWLTAHQFDPTRPAVKHRHIFLAGVTIFLQYIVYGLCIFPVLTHLFEG